MAQPATAASDLVSDPKWEVHDEHIDAGVAQANLVRRPDARQNPACLRGARTAPYRAVRRMPRKLGRAQRRGESRRGRWRRRLGRGEPSSL